MMAIQEGPGHSETKHGSFDLSGGSPSLDLVNTLEGRLEEPQDRLGTYEDLVSWTEAACLVDSATAESLRREALERPEEAQAALSAAKDLRETLFALFTALAGGDPPPPGALDRLNDALPEALSALRLVPGEEGFQWEWALGSGVLNQVLAPVIRDAADLLTSDELDRVRTCESETCAWLFLDKSRNRSRRWCDMSVCGNRAKARRFYERSKSE